MGWHIFPPLQGSPGNGGWRGQPFLSVPARRRTLSARRRAGYTLARVFLRIGRVKDSGRYFRAARAVMVNTERPCSVACILVMHANAMACHPSAAMCMLHAVHGCTCLEDRLLSQPGSAVVSTGCHGRPS